MAPGRRHAVKAGRCARWRWHHGGAPGGQRPQDGAERGAIWGQPCVGRFVTNALIV